MLDSFHCALSAPCKVIEDNVDGKLYRGAENSTCKII